jgi:hypothetical protein
MAEQERLLGKLRPANTNAAVIYAKPVGAKVIITALEICNNTAGAIAARLFFDYGTTYDQSTAILYDKSVAANDNYSRDTIRWAFAGPAGNLAVRSATGDALTFWVWGKEVV